MKFKVGDTIGFEDHGVARIIEIEGDQAYLWFRRGDPLKSGWVSLEWLAREASKSED